MIFFNFKFKRENNNHNHTLYDKMTILKTMNLNKNIIYYYVIYIICLKNLILTSFTQILIRTNLNSINI